MARNDATPPVNVIGCEMAQKFNIYWIFNPKF